MHASAWAKLSNKTSIAYDNSQLWYVAKWFYIPFRQKERSPNRRKTFADYTKERNVTLTEMPLLTVNSNCPSFKLSWQSHSEKEFLAPNHKNTDSWIGFQIHLTRSKYEFFVMAGINIHKCTGYNTFRLSAERALLMRERKKQLRFNLQKHRNRKEWQRDRNYSI